MIEATVSEIEKLLEITSSANSASTFKGVSIDTRTLQPGNLFVAIKGERVDGHLYIADAETKGASGLVVERKVDSPLPQIIVPNSIAALGQIATFWRNQFSLPFIGLTGSNGKTTLKNMVASILSAECDISDFVLSTQGNLNNDIGVPLTLFRLNKRHRYAVIEMGMNHFGEIEYLSKMVRPNIAIITNAAGAHTEFVGNVEGVARAKSEIFTGLTPDGIAILNADDAHFEYWHKLIGDHKYITFGLGDTAHVNSRIVNQSEFVLQTPMGEIFISLSLLGKHNIVNALAASAAALALGVDLDVIKTGLENVSAVPGRMHQYHLANNINIIDDAYNANPFSLQAAVDTLSVLPGRKILVLGDMKELGPKENELHAECGLKIKKAGIDHLLTFGKLSEATSAAFGANSQHFTQIDPLVTTLKSLLQNNTTVLVKGSRSMKMENIIAQIVPKEQLHQAH